MMPPDAPTVRAAPLVTLATSTDARPAPAAPTRNTATITRHPKSCSTSLPTMYMANELKITCRGRADAPVPPPPGS